MKKYSTASKAEVKDNSPRVPQRSKLSFDLSIHELKWTSKQIELIKLILDKETKVVFISGAAGTGKTIVSMYSALRLLQSKKMSDIVLVRPVVESSDSKLGYLPGELSEKYGVYLTAFQDKLSELLETPQVKALEKDERLIMCPINYARGLNWAAKFVFADECQNFTAKELVTLMTRVGEFSKLIICGDPDQSDLHGEKSKGFTKMMEVFSKEEDKVAGIHIIKLEDEDIMRSGLCKYIVKKLRTVKFNEN